MENQSDSNETHLAAACLLLSVAEADEILDEDELTAVVDILQEFFQLNGTAAEKLLKRAKTSLKEATGLFQFGKQLNLDFDHQDKIDFITCIFEVAYADGELHYLEHHTIKKIANILHIHRDDLIEAKTEIQSFLD